MSANKPEVTAAPEFNYRAKFEEMGTAINATLQSNTAKASQASLELYNVRGEIKKATDALNDAKEREANLLAELKDLSVVVNIAQQMKASFTGENNNGEKDSTRNEGAGKDK